jgi:hypothetical protein
MKYIAILTLLSAGALWGQGQGPAVPRLSDLLNPDPSVRESSFYSLLRPFSDSSGDLHSTIARFFVSHSSQRKQLSDTLILALELAVSLRNSKRQEGQPITESFSDYWADLMATVSFLRDPRAADALLGGVGTGGIATEGLADICPSAIDSIIAVVQASEPTSRGMPLGFRSGAVTALGACLRRMQLLRANPEVRPKVRAALLSVLDDEDWTVRIAATNASFAFRGEPEFRDKLNRIAGLDNYTSPLPRTAPGTTSFAVRDAARAALDADEKSSFYVVRSTQSLECRVESGTSEPSATAMLGPYATIQQAERAMCAHQDSTGPADLACRSVTPQAACGH